MMNRIHGILLAACATLLVSCASGSNGSTPVPPDGIGFESAESAFAALIAAVRQDDLQRGAVLLGSGSDDVLSSGDDVADREARRDFLAQYDAKHAIESAGEGRKILHVGNEDWPFPIPVVQSGGAWRFDTHAGAEELINRRVGRNELSTIQACLAFVDAQFEYAESDRDGDGLLEYAQQARSTPGKRDGLYWPTNPGEKLSPLGDLAANAAAEGYDVDRQSQGEASPFHGYLYRVLKGQGPRAKGGAYDYVVRDSMVGGFALIAYPADYGVSGVMSFIVNHDGVVHEKDLGESTSAEASSITRFDPDSTWREADTKN